MTGNSFNRGAGAGGPRHLSRPKTTSNADARQRSFTTGAYSMLKRLRQSSSGKSIPEENSSAGGGQRRYPSRKAGARSGATNGA